MVLSTARIICRPYWPARVLARLLAATAAALVIQTTMATSAAGKEPNWGAFGPEGARMREQLWVMPSADIGRAMRATVFRPAEKLDADGNPLRTRLVVINHGTDESTRLSVSMPVYFWLSRWFVDRGFTVVLPQRRGHGATGGNLSESLGTCDEPNHYASGLAAADDIGAAIDFMTKQDFVEPERVLVTGISTGGWASLALASRNLPNVEAIVSFAGGRGGHAYGHAGEVCGANELREAAGLYASRSHIPTVWFYSKNDSYFGPELAKGLAGAWRKAGGSVEAHILPAYGKEGHAIADDRGGWDYWGEALDQFLSRLDEDCCREPEIAARAPPQTPTVPPTPANLTVE